VIITLFLNVATHILFPILTDSELVLCARLTSNLSFFLFFIAHSYVFKRSL